jgi:cytochrome c biogenesis protein
MTAPTDFVDPLDAPDLSTPPRPAATGRWREALELLSSMRFAITLLAVICIASVIGTVVQQNEAFNNYVNKFGPFWSEVFGRFQLFTVYSAPWFLAILGFLVLSTSLCIARNAPKIVTDLRSYKEHIREQSLAAFHHKAEATLPLGREAALAQVAGVLGRSGWRARAQVRANGTMVAARTGRASKIGYLAAHSAIVLVCLGGLADGDLIVRLQMFFTGKSTFDGGYQFIKDVPAEHRLPAGNPTFRGNLMVPEGQRSGVAMLSMPQGIVLQELPFDVELKKFIVEYYETGMPRLFASDIVIHDHETGQAIPTTVKVNEPAIHRGIAIYQSSFEDGGSQVQLKALPLTPGGGPFDLKLRVGENTTLANKDGQSKLTLEMTGLKTINVENLANAGSKSEGTTDVRKVDLASTLDKHLGAGINPDKAKTMRNIGPAITYRLRDAAGQAREFHNYMVPVELDGQRVFLAGVRESANESFRYLRMPADENGSLDGWLRLKTALNDAGLRDKATRRYADQSTPEGRPEMNEQLRVTASRALTLFAGLENVPGTKPGDKLGGLNALSQFIEVSVPEAERTRVAEVMLRILNGALYDLNQLAREQAGLKPLEPGPATENFMTQAVLSLSDSYFYPAPLLLQLEDFTPVQASVFQVARAPGKTLVYLGAVLLILGVFAMLYVRERRLWVWLADGESPGTTRLQLAMSTPRRTLDIDAEFETLRQRLLAGGQTP